MLYADIIKSFVTRKCQIIWKIYENKYYWRRDSSYLLNDLRNFHDILRKDVTYDNIKSHKKSRDSPSLWKMYFWKNHRGVTSRLKLDSHLQTKTPAWLERKCQLQNLWRHNLVNKQLQYTNCPISHDVKTTRQWNLVN